MEKKRRCGCDRRDVGTYVQDGVPSPIACDACDAMPCCWVARFSCVVPDLTSANGNVYMRVLSQFANNCEFVSLYWGTTFECEVTQYGVIDTPHGPYLYGWCGTPGGSSPPASCPEPWLGCTWCGRIVQPGVLVPVIGWVLDTANLAAVTMTDSITGVSYLADSTWDCTGPNTMTMTTDHSLAPRLDRQICVSPLNAEMDGIPSEGGSEFPEWIICDGVTPRVEHDCCDENLPCGYANETDRKACCDPCCDTLPDQPLWMKCAGCESSTTVTPTVGASRGTDGANSNGGQTYWAEATLCTHLLQVGWYCDGADWWADIWVDNVFCESLNLGPPVSCCPLVIGTGSSDCTVDCCIGVGEECQLCCATNLPDGVPAEVTAQFTLLSGTCAAVDGTEQAIAIPGTTDVTLCANNKLSITTGLIACIPGADPDMLDLTTELFCDNVSQGTVHTVIPCSYFASTPFWTETKNTGATDCCCNGPISFTVDFVL